MKSNLGYARLGRILLVKSDKVEITKFGPLKSRINNSEGECDMNAEGVSIGDAREAIAFTQRR